MGALHICSAVNHIELTVDFPTCAMACHHTCIYISRACIKYGRQITDKMRCSVGDAMEYCIVSNKDVLKLIKLFLSHQRIEL